MVRRIPNASGNIRVHDSVMMALSVLLVIAADVVDDDDDDSSWVMFGGGISYGEMMMCGYACSTTNSKSISIVFFSADFQHRRST